MTSSARQSLISCCCYSAAVVNDFTMRKVGALLDSGFRRNGGASTVGAGLSATGTSHRPSQTIGHSSPFRACRNGFYNDQFRVGMIEVAERGIEIVCITNRVCRQHFPYMRHTALWWLAMAQHTASTTAVANRIEQFKQPIF